MVPLSKRVRTPYKYYYRLQKSKVFLNYQNLLLSSSKIVGIYFKFNFVIYFCPEYLGSKPNTITYRENLYLKEERATYNSINL